MKNNRGPSSTSIYHILCNDGWIYEVMHNKRKHVFNSSYDIAMISPNGLRRIVNRLYNDCDSVWIFNPTGSNIDPPISKRVRTDCFQSFRIEVESFIRIYSAMNS